MIWLATMTMYSIRGPCHWVNSETVPVSSVTEAMARINKLYEAGTPFFTKQSIREVSKQLRRSSLCGDKITVKAVDGVRVEFDVLTGETRNGFDSGAFEHEMYWFESDRVEKTELTVLDRIHTLSTAHECTWPRV